MAEGCSLAVQPGEQAPKTPYALPGVALALSIGGLCICISSVVGAILGIVALVRIRREPQLRGRGLAIAAIVVAVGLVPFQAGVLAAIAIPNFIRYQARAKQAECRTNLRAILSAQQTYRATHGRAATQFSELDASILPGNRYTYLLSSGALLPVVVVGNLANVSLFFAGISGPEQLLAGHPMFVVTVIFAQIVTMLVLVGLFSFPGHAQPSR